MRFEHFFQEVRFDFLCQSISDNRVRLRHQLIQVIKETQKGIETSSHDGIRFRRRFRTRRAASSSSSSSPASVVSPSQSPVRLRGFVRQQLQLRRRQFRRQSAIGLDQSSRQRRCEVGLVDENVGGVDFR